MADAILCFNAGSSTIKFALFDASSEGPVEQFRGQVDGLGKTPRFRVWDAARKLIEDRTDGLAASNQEGFTGEIVRWARSRLDGGIVACSHRVAHGGTGFTDPVEITPGVMARLEALCPLAPLHQPHNLAVARAAQAASTLQVACFDTGFHHTLPPAAQRIALPQPWPAMGVRRYGFHGLSYRYLSRELSRRDPVLAARRVLFAHLGSGASLCAAVNGVSVDTTMGFSALDGLVMSTRCGSIDPGALLFLLSKGVSPGELETMLYNRAGLLAVSGSTGDMRALLDSHDTAAIEAVELFVHRVAREIGAMTASMEGIDGLVFSAGIGENSVEIRARICERLAWLGARLDPEANRNPKGPIGAPGSALAVWVIPTDEEQILAEGACSVMRSRAAMDLV